MGSAGRYGWPANAIWVDGSRGRRLRQRIPDAGEAEVLEVFHVGGGEFSDAMVAQGESEAGVVDAAIGKLGCGSVGPDFPHEATGVIDEFPVRMLAKGLDHGHGCGGEERRRPKFGVAQEAVEFGEPQFAEHEIGGGGLRFKPKFGDGVPRMG